MTTEDGPRHAADPRPASRSDSSASSTGTSRRGSRTGSRAAASPVRTRRPPQRKSFLRELPGIVITALVISVLIKTFLVQAFYIPSGSMENTLLVNDRVLVNKLADKPDEIHRGDVVVFRDPGGWLAGAEASTHGSLVNAVRDGLVFVGLAPAAGEEDLIKRVIGVGGDKVACCDDAGHITVNGQSARRAVRLPRRRAVRREVRRDRAPRASSGSWATTGRSPRTAAPTGSSPGRASCPSTTSIGRAFTIVWPLDRARMLHRPPTFEPARARRSRALTGPAPGTVVESSRWGWCGSSSYGARAASTPTSRRSSAPG